MKKLKVRNLKRNVTEALELPREVILNLPLLSITGREELCIENYKGIVEYNDQIIRVNTSTGMIKIGGKNLFLKQITAENLVITGGLLKIEFLV